MRFIVCMCGCKSVCLCVCARIVTVKVAIVVIVLILSVFFHFVIIAIIVRTVVIAFLGGTYKLDAFNLLTYKSVSKYGNGSSRVHERSKASK